MIHIPQKHSTSSWKHIKKKDCPHISRIKTIKAGNKKKCEECDVEEDLRMCMTCGFVGCCESSNAHDTEHFKKTGHPFIKPHKCGYDFLWCYKCNAFLD